MGDFYSIKNPALCNKREYRIRDFTWDKLGLPHSNYDQEKSQWKV